MGSSWACSNQKKFIFFSFIHIPGLFSFKISEHFKKHAQTFFKSKWKISEFPENKYLNSPKKVSESQKKSSDTFINHLIIVKFMQQHANKRQPDLRFLQVLHQLDVLSARAFQEDNSHTAED
jgi:hypothetical protein